MNMIRIIPCLLLKGTGLVKTTKFKNPRYIGDPRNAVKIFNEKEVDELIILDIESSPENKEPQFDLLREIVSEAFMPVAYGGGIKTHKQALTLINLGIEKIIISSKATREPQFVSELSEIVGSQSVVVCIDVKKSKRGHYSVYCNGGSHKTHLSLLEYAQNIVKLGAGEIVVNSIDQDGTMAGYDLRLIKMISESVEVPVVALGGAGNLADLKTAVEIAGASAVSAGSMFVYRGERRAVLISYPKRSELLTTFHQ